MTPQALKCINKPFFFFEITSRHQNYVQIFTDGLKVDEKVAAAAVLSVAQNSPFSCRLRDHCFIYSAELRAILFALKQAYQSQDRKFMISFQTHYPLQSLHSVFMTVENCFRLVVL